MPSLTATQLKQYEEEGFVAPIDILLSNIMLYLVTKTFNTASWIYYGRREEGGRALPKDHLPLKVPTAIAKFPKEYLEWAPRSYVERI